MDTAWREGQLWSVLSSPYTKKQSQTDWEPGGMTPVRPEPQSVSGMDIGGTIGHQFEFEVKINTWDCTIVILPRLRPTKIDRKMKNRLRANFDISMATPDGGVITNNIDLKNVDKVTYLNFDKVQRVKIGKGPDEMIVPVTRCGAPLFQRVQCRARADGVRVPQKVTHHEFPTPHSEEGRRMIEEGPLAPDLGQDKKKRRVEDEEESADKRILRMLKDDVELLYAPTLKVLQKGFNIEVFQKEEERKEDITFSKIVTLLKMIKDGQTLLEWRRC